jgi:hypothetical protein
MAEKRKMESSEQANNRKRKIAEKMAEKRKLGTPQQHQKWIEKMLEYSRAENGNNRKNQINGISLLNEFEGEILENERGINVSMISKNIEIETAVKKAFEHIMKTKIGQDETIPDDSLQMIHQSLSTEQNGRNIEIPQYDQLHQANVCVICDRFVTGTADLNWIKKNTLIQHKARLTIPDINSELQKCYQVSDPDLHELLLSPRARFKKNGEYQCCTQCERALQNDRLDKNPPKYAIANNFAIGTLPQQLSGLLTDVTSPLLSPVRPFAYMMSYSGGAHKSITGTFTFFNQSVEKNIGTLNFHSNTTGNNTVFVVLSGNFTPAQRNIVRNKM